MASQGDFFAFISQPPALWILAVALGLIVGSFLNVVIYRLPKMMTRQWHRECVAWLAEQRSNSPTADEPETPLGLAYPNSTCPQCAAPIKPWHNIPIVSYLWLRGRCAACNAAIGLRYPLVEASGALLALAVLWAFGPTGQGVFALLLVWTLLALTGIDIDTHLLPDSLTLPLLWLGLLVNTQNLFVPLEDGVIGAAAGYLVLWSIFWLFKLLTGKEGMGYGDFKLLAALGAWFGWQSLPLIILLSSAVGALVGIALIVFKGQGRSVPIPFGPYLAGAGCLYLFFGETLNRLYLGGVG
jgi:leader peptidase (prepilin peptidase)/N-methyltransferase